MSILNNENHSLCSVCQGACCKRMPGAVIPQQFNQITLDLLVDLLTSGYCLDYWEGYIEDDNGNWGDSHEDKPAYFLRPKIKGHETSLVHGAWRGECVFLTEKGCSLSFKERPYFCQILVPHEDNTKCSPDNSKEGLLPSLTKKEAVKAWLPYQELITAALREAENLS